MNAEQETIEMALQNNVSYIYCETRKQARQEQQDINVSLATGELVGLDVVDAVSGATFDH